MIKKNYFLSLDFLLLILLRMGETPKISAWRPAPDVADPLLFLPVPSSPSLLPLLLPLLPLPELELCELEPLNSCTLGDVAVGNEGSAIENAGEAVLLRSTEKMLDGFVLPTTGTVNCVPVASATTGSNYREKKCYEI